MNIWLRLNSCCYCISLQTGTIIILLIGLVLSVSRLVGLSGNEHKEFYEHEIEFSAHKRYVIIAGVILLQVLPCVLGLIGICMKKPGYLKLFVIISFIFIIFQLLCFILFLYLSIFDEDGKMSKGIVTIRRKSSDGDTDTKALTKNLSKTMALATFIELLFTWYFTSVVYSYYQQLIAGSATSYHGDTEMSPPPPHPEEHTVSQSVA